jgi:hypothetical protein
MNVIPIAISDMYRLRSATAKNRFKPIIGSINLETASIAPPAINNTVVTFDVYLNPIPNDTRNKN